MKIIISILLLISQGAFSQLAKKEVRANQNQAAIQVTNDKAKARMQVGNKYNDKFIEKYHYQNDNQTIICESSNGRRNHCNVDTRYGVNLVRQLSNSSCNYHWGYDQSGIWVDSGCRAEFSINYGWDQTGSEGNILICESHRNKRNYCPANLNGRDVFLLRQVSNSSCVNNWNYDRNGVWVTNGCRAEFVVEDRNYNTAKDIVICSSRNLQFQGCQADTRGGVEFVRQLSSASCNRNWGYDRQGIWVNNGCRAKFKLMPYNNYNNNHGSQNRLVNCSSKNHRRKVCPVDTSGGVRLKKRKSRASCQNNWGFGQDHIWVDNGCRATFEIQVDRNNYGNNNGYGQNNNHGNNQNNHGNYGNGQNNNGNNQNNRRYGNQQNTVICESTNSRRRTCSIPQGAKVQLSRQLSRKSCNGAWGYNRKEIWVTNGCRAEFSVF